MCSSTMMGRAVPGTQAASPPKSNEISHFRWLLLSLSFLLFSTSINAQKADYRVGLRSANLVTACDAPPAPESACTPPGSYDVDINLTGGTLTWGENHPQLGDCQDFTKVARITGCGIVRIPDDLNLQFKSSGAILVIDGPDLIVNGGNFQMDESGSKFIMDGGALRIFGNFQQTTNTVQCITGTLIEVGEEDANEGFTEGQFNNSSNTKSSADWQNDGGYRYIKDCCINVTHDYQLQSSGSGSGTSGVDVLINCCIEIGDQGSNNATGTAFGVSDGDDSGNFQNNNRMYIFDTDIVVANGDFQNSNNTMTACNMDVKLNKSGNFQINSGTLEGDGLCIAAEDQIENSGTWTANISSWYSDKNNAIVEGNAITGTVPAESSESSILAACFTECCTADDCVIPDPVIVVTCDTKDNTDPSDDMFSYTIQVANPDPGCSAGSFSITGDDSESGLAYDQVHGPYGPFMASNGSLSITITDDSDSDCSTDAEVVPDCPQDPCEGKDCDDGCPYTVDTCDPNTGECVHTLVEPDCDDNCPYTTDEYNEATCECENTLVTPDCDDNCPYTTDEYNEATCECENTLVTPDCDDNCPYTTDEYNEATCECENTLVTPDCDDNCPYTTDEYNEATCECENTLVTPDCDDNCPYTTDEYNETTCECENTLVTPDCDDNCPYTTDEYNEATCECENTLVTPDCDDNCPYTTDEYNEATCECENTLVTPDCDDNCPYTTDEYNEATCECENTLVTPDCDDNCPYTTDEYNEATCECENTLVTPDCDDNCPYTTDEYNEATCECENTLVTPDCDDNDCTTQDSYNTETCECENTPITPTPDCESCPPGTSPSYSGGVTADGNSGEWDLTNDFFANMYEAGNPTKQLLSKAYLRYDCSTNILCVLVLTEIDVTADQVADEAWVKVYDISNSTQIDGNSSDFAWVPNQMGWEGCFSLAEASYDEIEIHVNVTWDGESGRTSSTGKGGQGNAIPLCIECPDDPCEGKDCDDGCPYTVDTCDPNTGECINTLVEPDCDDNCPYTTDEYDADNCECKNTLVTPDCDDNCPYTTDEYNEATCECENTLVTPDCDDNCPYTTDEYNEATCECENTLVTPDCDDNCPYTTDEYNEATCECENTLVTPDCDDNCPYTTDEYNEATCECENTLVTPDCDDNCPYTTDEYNEATCECENTLVTPDCDDNCPYTTDEYNEATCECENTLVTPDCDDNCPYTTDEYNEATCECENTLVTPDCDDNCPYTDDSYDPNNCECVNTPNTPDCDDNCPYTIDSYDPNTCECVNTPDPPSCDDNCPYTDDSYDADNCECINTPNPPDCDDNCPYTDDSYDADNCECVNTPNPPDCNDNCPYTDDSYDADNCECVNTPNTPDCDDGKCTTNDYYDPNNCECVNEPITPPSCDDGKCTTNDYYDEDLCECVNEPIDTPDCDDDNCTTLDYFDHQICECVNEPIDTPDCDDGKCTTNDYYDTDLCECVNEPITPPSCDDHDCTTNDYYDESICECVNEPLTPPSCDDGSECTRDYYDETICECVNEPIVCDDGDPCTVDYCDPQLGCVFEPIDDLSCGDGTIDCEGQTEATYDPNTGRYTLYAEGCWHDCLQPDRDVHFYQELCGDGELIAHVVSITGSGHAGVVMREGLDPVGRRVGAMTKLYANTIRREWREEYGAPVHQMPAFRPGVEWFRMIRKGNQVKVYTSERGDYWRLFYKVTYPNLASCLNVGLMAYSSSGASEITAVFDNVEVIPAGSSFRPIEEVFVPGKLSAEDQVLIEEYGKNDPRVRFEIASDQLTSEKLAVYPNPAKEEAFVTIPQFEGTQQAVLVLYNSTGQEVLRRRVDTGISRTEMIPLSDLDAGVYVFRLMIDGKKDLSQRLVISK